MFSPWGSSAPVTITTSPDDFTFPGDSNDDFDIGGVTPPVMNQSNPFNLSDLSSTLPPSLMPTDSGSDEVGGLYIESFISIIICRSG